MIILSVTIFLIGVFSASTIFILVLLQLVKRDFQFWPPPSPSSWQKKLFRALFRMFFLSLVILSLIDFQHSNLWRYIAGSVLLVLGIGAALRWTGLLGWRNSFGEPTGLQTTGPFVWSRNPVYMTTIVGMMGWALLVNSSLLTILLAFWALLYFAAPFVEEPWLEIEFGDDYRTYKARTSRYFWPPV